MNKKQLLQLIGSLFVAVIFVASYTSMSNNALPAQNNPSRQTTTIGTVYGYSFANATVTGYGSTATLSIGCNSVTQMNISSEISSMLIALGKNNSVSNYYSPASNVTLVYMGRMNMTQFYGYVSNSIGSNDMSCTSIQTDADVLLPSTLNFYVNSQAFQVTVPNSMRTQKVAVFMHKNMNDTLRLKIYMLVAANGSIYGNMSILVV
ncbi:MAG: hypothetical protein ACP5RF_00170 [Candidatus Micrarchaeia archaeon]